MKRIAIIVLVALAICGCQVKEIGEFTPESKIEPEAKVFIAEIEDNNSVGTKTSLDNRGNVLWKQGDQVSIFAGSTINEQYQVTDASDGKTSAALNRVTSPGFVAGTDIDHNVAYYPYASSASIAKDNGSYSISDIMLPATQTYAEDSFGNGAFPMTAVTTSVDDLRLKFKNVLGGLKLQLTGTATIASISVTGNSNEILCGAAEVTVSNGSVPSITLTDATAKTVTLDCGEGVQLNTETATLFVIALPPMTMEGGFTVVVTDTEGGQMEIKTTKEQIINRSRMLTMPAVTYGATSYSGHQYVDLGLPSGLKWATCNIGANTPEEYGDYFAWGEIEPYYSSLDPLTWKDGKSAGYNWASYQWSNGKGNTFTKYNTNSPYGLVDNRTILELADDAANANWGGSWRMPTNDEWTELRTKCTWTWTVYNGVNGMLVTGPNGNSIFLPAAGGRTDTSLYSSGSWGYYWSSSLSTGYPGSAWRVGFGSDGVYRDAILRYSAPSVRPVTDEGVRVSVSGITLDHDVLQLRMGATIALEATVTPINATQPAVIWSSSNTSVATVDCMGMVSAVSAGSATITATTYDGGFTATCTVTVANQIIIKELYATGCQRGESNTYFNDAYTILYNNSALEADASDIVFCAIAPNTPSASKNFYVDGVSLLFENEDWIPAYSAIWWFDSEVKIPAYSQIVVAFFGAIDHTLTVSESVDLSDPSYYWMNNKSVEGFTANKYSVSENIPSEHYLSGAKINMGTAWIVANNGPGFYIARMSPEEATALAQNTDAYDTTLGTSGAMAVAKFPKSRVIDAIDVFNTAYLAKSKSRFSSDIITSTFDMPNLLGYSVYRNVDKEATEALEENAGKLVYNYAGGTEDVEGSTDPSGIDAEASIAAGAHIIYSDTNSMSNDYHARKVASLKK